MDGLWKYVVQMVRVARRKGEMRTRNASEKKTGDAELEARAYKGLERTVFGVRCSCSSTKLGTSCVCTR